MSSRTNESGRVDGKIQRNEVQLSVAHTTSSSPNYSFRIYRDGKQLVEVIGRFAIFRDFYNSVNSNKVCDILLKKEFPPTLVKSSLGVGLSEQEVENRRDMLDEWMRDLFDHFNDFPPSARTVISKFAQLPEAELELVEIPPPPPDMPMSTTTKDLESPDNKSTSLYAVSNALRAVMKFKSSSKLISDDTNHEKPDGAPYLENAIPVVPVKVHVSRGSVSGGHQTYELNIKYDPRERPFIVSKFFKEYRALMQALAQVGVRHADYLYEKGSEHSESIYVDQVLVPIPSEFPKTYPKSSLGISLTEDELHDRCLRLDKWSRDVLALYCQFPPEAKMLVAKFIGYVEGFDEDKPALVLEKLQLPGSVVGNSKPVDSSSPPKSPVIGSPVNQSPIDNPSTEPRMTLPSESIASSEVQLNAPSIRGSMQSLRGSSSYLADAEGFQRVMREDGLIQPIRVEMSYTKVDGHPVYSLSLFRSDEDVAVATIKHQFAAYRDLHTKLNADQYCEMILSASFPPTLRRSSLGVGLSERMIDARMKGLRNWWVDLLDHYSDMPGEKKVLVSAFLSVPITDLELVKDESIRDINSMHPDRATFARDSSAYMNGVFRRAVRSDNLVQKNIVEITYSSENGHPMYALIVRRNDNTAINQIKHQFAAYRNLFGRLNVDNYCVNLLTAPFPATQRRSSLTSLGLGLGEEAIETRRQELQTWWVDLLDHMNELSSDRQSLVSTFLGIAVPDLLLVEDTPPAMTSNAAFTKSSLSVLSHDIIMEGDDERESEDQVKDPEWQEIESKPTKKPVTCCIVS